MKGFQVLYLLGCLFLVSANDFSVIVDGEEITDEAAAMTAMGVWGLNLVEDSHKAVNTYQPQSIGIRPKDIEKTQQLKLGALGYMMKYGYLEVATQQTEEELLESDKLLSDEQLREAIRRFQRYNGLEETGVPNPETLRLMSQARCGAKDMEYEPPTRAKRYATSRVKWGKHELTYWFNPAAWSEDMPQKEFRSEFEAALTLWANAGKVSFREVETEEKADVKIGFYYGDHGDKYAFQGPGWELAHAFYPKKGELHFDDAEPFTAGTVNGINFKFVALHEMGHILGIKHADASNRQAIMYALYTGYSDDLQLDEDDKFAVTDRMGIGSGQVFPLGDGGEITEAPTEIPDTPPVCITEIDAAFHWDSNPGYVYVFAGAWYYRLKPRNPNKRYNLPLLDGDSPPKRIGIDGFLNLPRKLDATIAHLQDANKFYAFKGQTYLIYDIRTSEVTENGTLSDLWPTDTPTKIDGALRIDQRTLGFMSGDRLYKYENDDKTWVVGEPGSNYFHKKYTGMTASSITFYKEWVWIFQGAWYTVARASNGVASKNYKLRLIKNDIKLPMCAEGAGSLNTQETRMCKNQLKKIKRKKGYVPSSVCLDFISERYKGEVVFDENDF